MSDVATFDPEHDCHDCGTARQHWRMRQWGKPYCRRCGAKNGYASAFRVELDVDRLLEHFGGDVERLEAFVRSTAPNG